MNPGFSLCSTEHDVLFVISVLIADRKCAETCDMVLLAGRSIVDYSFVRLLTHDTVV